MTSTLKVSEVQDPTNSNSAITINSSGLVSFPNTSILGITMADQFRLSASFSTSGATITGWERPTDANGNNMRFAQLGTGMTESSGIFSFPSTGYYLIYISGEVYCNSGDGFGAMELHVTENNSTYVKAANMAVDGGGSGANRGNGSLINLMNITDITNQKFRTETDSLNSGSSIQGHTDYNRTVITVLKIAGSQ
tara:strand:+ start:804 stop:1388 length:585 start_codon:yes stop_codon:yes gene_type:complete